MLLGGRRRRRSFGRRSRSRSRCRDLSRCRRRSRSRHGGMSITWKHVEKCARKLTEFMWPVDFSVAVASSRFRFGVELKVSVSGVGSLLCIHYVC